MAQKQFIIDGGFNTNADSQITGNLSMTGSVLPTVDSDGVTGFDLGSPAAKWRDLYLSQGSLYIDGQKVLQSDSGTIVFKADEDQGMTIRTEGTGVLTLQSPNPLAIAATLQMAAGKKITDANGTAVVFGDKIDADFNQIINVGTPSANAHAATKFYVDDAISNLVNGAGAALDTLNELAAALGNDANFSTTISTQLATKATVVALEAEVTRATAAETANAGAISDEIAARVTAVSNEASARTSADAALQTAIDNEASARTAADASLADDIAAEVTAREAAVTALEASIASTVSDAGTDLAAETLARESADSALAGDIATNATAITAEASTRASADTALQTAIDTKLASSSYTAADVLTKIKTVDGAGSGLDADLLDGQSSAYYATAASVTSEASTRASADTALQTAIDTKLASSSYTAADVLTKIKTVDGSGSGLDADLLDGQSSAYYATAASVTSEASARASGDSSTLTSAQSYTDTKISALVNGASAAFDTLKEIQDAMATDAELASAISGLTIGNGTMTISAGGGLSGGGSFTANQTGNSTVSLSHANSGVTAGSYQLVTVNASGHVTAGSNPGYVTSSGVTSVATGNGLTGGTITGTGTLSMSGSYTGNFSVTGAITASGDVTAYSDASLKTNVQTIAHGLDKVMALRGITFERIADGSVSTGVIAQDVHAVLPEAVAIDAEGVMAVKYGNLVGLLIEAVKELKSEVETLKGNGTVH